MDDFYIIVHRANIFGIIFIDVQLARHGRTLCWRALRGGHAIRRQTRATKHAGQRWHMHILYHLYSFAHSSCWIYSLPLLWIILIILQETPVYWVPIIWTSSFVYGLNMIQMRRNYQFNISMCFNLSFTIFVYSSQFLFIT